MSTVKHLSFAGVTLPLVPPFIEERWLRFVHKQSNFSDADFWNFSSPGLASIPTPAIPRPPDFSLGTLHWPTGASRPAWFHCIVETTRLNQIKSAVGTRSTPKPLVLSDGRTGYEVAARMFALPERPLNQLGSDLSDSWLLTLTDVRFYWNWRRGNITQPVSWTHLYSQIGSILGVAVAPDSVDSRYGSPSGKWVLPYRNTPAVFDAAAAQVGQRVVVGLDGSVRTVNWETAQDASDAYVTESGPVVSGGFLSQAGIARYVPEKVKVLFSDDSDPGSAAPYAVDRTLTSLAIGDYGTSQGVAGYYESVNADLPYTCLNVAAVEAYATAAAQDWYGWRLSDVDAVYPGVEPWVPTGWEDAVEWTLKLSPDNPALDDPTGNSPDLLSQDPYRGIPVASTLIRRGPWLDFRGDDFKPEGPCRSGVPVCAPAVVCPDGASGAGSGCPEEATPSDDGINPDCVESDGTDPVGVRDTFCLDGIQYVTRGRMQLVSDAGRAKLTYYDLTTTEEGCCQCDDGSGSGNETVCCPSWTSPKQQIEVAVSGPFGADCEFVEMVGVLYLIEGFTGVLEPVFGSDQDVTATVQISCPDGNDWSIKGVVTTSDGTIIAISDTPLAQDTNPLNSTYGMLIGTADVAARTDCRPGIVDVVSEYPCNLPVPQCFTTCDQCPGGIYSELGLLTTDAALTLYQQNDPLDGNTCRFVSLDGEWELKFGGGWTLLNLDDLRVWQLPAELWNCCGRNDMTPDRPEYGEAAVTPQGECCEATPVDGSVDCNFLEEVQPDTLYSSSVGAGPTEVRWYNMGPVSTLGGWVVQDTPYKLQLTNTTSEITVVVLGECNEFFTLAEGTSAVDFCLDFTAVSGGPQNVQFSVESAAGASFEFRITQGSC